MGEEELTKEEKEVMEAKLEMVAYAAESHLAYMESVEPDSVEFIEYDLVAIEEAFLYLYSFYLSHQDKRLLN